MCLLLEVYYKVAVWGILKLKSSYSTLWLFYFCHFYFIQLSFSGFSFMTLTINGILSVERRLQSSSPEKIQQHFITLGSNDCFHSITVISWQYIICLFPGQYQKQLRNCPRSDFFIKALPLILRLYWWEEFLYKSNAVSTTELQNKEHSAPMFPPSLTWDNYRFEGVECRVQSATQLVCKKGPK